jgi:septum formation protein
MRFVLASASPTRLRVLQQAGFDPEVVVSGVDEEIDIGDDIPGAALLLAQRKATAVAGLHRDAVVLGCDSIASLLGRPLNKPASREEAHRWGRAMRGQAVAVSTGHCVMYGDAVASLVDTAKVWFGEPSDEELDRYVESGESDDAAGGFRLEGRAAAFITRVDGHPGTVHGVSPFVVRRLLRELGIEVTALWV